MDTWSARTARLGFLALLVPIAACANTPPRPQTLDHAWSQRGQASWYGDPFHGRTTSNGEVYDMESHTAAHPWLPFNTWVEVHSLDNGRATRVRINDRGPFLKGRIIDLSRAAAAQLGMIECGVAAVELTLSSAPPSPAVAPDTEPMPVASLPPPAPGYTVQIGAFATLTNALALGEKLRQSYAEVEVSTAGDRLNRVTVGRDLDRAAAEDLVRRLADDGYASMIRTVSIP